MQRTQMPLFKKPYNWKNSKSKYQQKLDHIEVTD